MKKTMLDVNKISREEAEALRFGLVKRRMERSLYDFTKEAWHVIDPAPFVGGGFSMQAVCDHLQACADGNIRNLIINIPPRFSKSTLCGVLFPAWVFAQPENTPVSGNGVQFLHASYSQTLALQDSLKCRRLLESDWYLSRWGNRVQVSSDQNTKSQFDLESGGRRMTTSVGGSTTGLGGQYLICDDPNNARESNSEAVIMSTIEWWDMAWSTRLNDPKTGCRIVVQQRLNERDITGHILSQDIGNWTHLMLPMEFEPNRRIYTVLVPDSANDGEGDIVWTDPRKEEGELLWPERFGPVEVDNLKKTLGPYGTAGQLQMRPQPAGGGIIKRTWWEPYEGADFPDMEVTIGSLDLAYTTKKENDFSAMTCWGIWRDSGTYTAVANKNFQGTVSSRIQSSDQGGDIPKIMLTNAWKERLEFHDLVAKVVATARESKLDILLVEAKGPGISVAQEIRRLVGIEEFSVREVSPNDLDKTARLYAVQHLFAEGLVYAPTKIGDPDTFRVWADMVVTEVESFPKGIHDDLCLVGDTMILMADGTEKRIDQIIVGDKVKTPNGIGNVSASSFTGIKPIWELTHTKGTLRGTGSHPIYANGEWKPLASLCQYDMLETSHPFEGGISWHLNQNPVSLLKLLYSMAKGIVGIPKQRMLRIADIFRELARGFIGMFGYTIMDPSQMDTKFTTSMAIQPTMTFPILNALHLKSTGQNTQTIIPIMENHKNSWITFVPLDRWLLIGTKAKKVVSGINNMLTKPLNILMRQNRIAKAITKENVSGAVMDLQQKPLKKHCVQYPANKQNLNISVVKQVRYMNIMLPVYNLTIDDEHCYYANGILTHNCDTVSQAITFMRKSGMIQRGAERTFELSESQRFAGNAGNTPLYPS